VERLVSESSASIREALALALCEAVPENVPPSTRRRALESLTKLYRTELESSVQSAVERLLARWGPSADGPPKAGR
jgi:hypothetical protein